jgi:glyoxylase-like metal-dependent hydrolase (beta-lactamase superfamily II)
MRLGNTNLRLVSDGEHWVDGAGLFGLVPKTEWREMAEPDEQNRVRTQLYCLLIETEEQKILVDTGYGDKLSDQEREFIRLEGDGRLLASLAASGVAPEDVDMVINTHLHGDHCGGNTRYNEKGDLVPTFPNALYYVQRIELADAMFPNQRTRGTYHRENLDSVERAGQLRVLWGDTRLTEEVRVLVTPGHTPAHQCVVIESVDTVVFRPISEAATRAAKLEAGGVHLIQDVLPDQMDDLEESGHVVVPDEAFQLQYVFFITDDETLPTCDLKMRQALNYAVDVDAIIENLLAGLDSRIASPVGPGYMG